MWHFYLKKRFFLRLLSHKDSTSWRYLGDYIKWECVCEKDFLNWILKIFLSIIVTEYISQVCFLCKGQEPKANWSEGKGNISAYLNRKFIEKSSLRYGWIQGFLILLQLLAGIFSALCNGSISKDAFSVRGSNWWQPLQPPSLPGSNPG